MPIVFCNEMQHPFGQKGLLECTDDVIVVRHNITRECQMHSREMP